MSDGMCEGLKGNAIEEERIPEVQAEIKNLASIVERLHQKIDVLHSKTEQIRNPSLALNSGTDKEKEICQLGRIIRDLSQRVNLAVIKIDSINEELEV